MSESPSGRPTPEVPEPRRIDLRNRWMNDPAYLAQAAHFFGAAFAVVAYRLLFGAGHFWVFLAAGVDLAALKEYAYDANFEEPKQTWRDNTLDFAFYVLGAAFSTGLIFLFRK